MKEREWMIQVLALSQVTPPCASEVIHSHVLWRKNANAPRTVAFGGVVVSGDCHTLSCGVVRLKYCPIRPLMADSSLLSTQDAGSALWRYCAINLLLQRAWFYFEKNYWAEDLSCELWIKGDRTLAILFHGLATFDKNGKGNVV